MMNFILEICLAKNKIGFERELFADSSDEEYSLVAKYKYCLPEKERQ